MPTYSRPTDTVLVTASLLLALRDLGEGHGWGLVSQLRRSGLVVEPGRAYRILRSLESAGLASSSSTQSLYGPRRRTYRITHEGRQHLDELAAHVTAVWQLNDAFVQTHEHTPVQGQATQSAEWANDHDASHDDDRVSADPQTPNDTSAYPRATSDLVVAWLLLLIDHRASHGYGLRRALADHDVHTDAAMLYRVLRKLEDSGWLDSRWSQPVRGPRRRLYGVTDRGRRNLEDVAQTIRSSRDRHGAFLHLYARWDRHARRQA